MFFDKLSDIPEIAKKNGTAIFVVPADFIPDFKRAFVLQPEEKKTITIEQVRNLIAKLGKKQLSDRLIIINTVELLNEEAANAFLKNLEEPQDKVHFALLTNEISAVMPTILSRSALYYYRDANDFDSVVADEKIKQIAKRLLVAKKSDLVEITDEIAARKDRKYVLDIISTSIQLLYKSYFLTKKPIFLERLLKFIRIYENLQKNGHLKLQIIANLC
ncbi:hypothetical protein IKF28_00815 [Candidatus Saccharibacteria bacterium]|nr:hypothetical protein [Candidatus Saccharibacteria bacterium]MBR3121972.1 hypothetical protein [Candidatus Saccharibacteria bacterium]